MRFGKRKSIAETGKNLALECRFSLRSAIGGNCKYLCYPFCLERLENRIAKWLERDPRTDIIEQGLGANDAPGATHLLRLRADDMGWMSLTDNAMAVLGENTLNQMNNIEK